MFKYKNKKEKSRVKKAFSFMEVIIVVAIIGIMTSVILAFVAQSKYNTELETTANEIVASIRKIQNYALSGKEVSPGCTKYRFNATAGGNSFVIDNGGGGCSFSEVYNLKNGIIFGNNAFLVFNVPFGDRDDVNNTVDITITKSANDYHICVTGVGVVTIQKNPC